MKKNIQILSIILISTLVFVGCGKYEEGPKLSLLTKKARIANSWALTTTVINGKTTVIEKPVIFLTLEKDGSGEFEGTLSIPVVGETSIKGKLEWELSENKEDIKYRYQVSNVWTEWASYKILKLKNNEMWLKDKLGSETHYTTRDK